MDSFEKSIDEVLSEIYKCGSEEDTKNLAMNSFALWDGETLESFSSFLDSNKPMCKFWSAFMESNKFTEDELLT